MAESVGALQVDVVADTSALVAQIGAKSTAAGTAAGAGMGKGMIAGFAGLAVGAVIVGSVAKAISSAGAFEQQMNVVQEAASASGTEMKALSDLALQMGKDTVFSAQEAADAMLELVKSGLTPAQVEAGALEQALNLAATEGIGMADSAKIMANAMNTFGIKAGNAQEVSDALAGASVASSAGVMDIAQALSQVGPSATDAGLSIQETTAALAAFADKGIQGSDAGTSLKTFLARLVPQTESAGEAFNDLGLKMTDNEGNFISLAAMSQELQDGLRGMSDAERTAALNSAFGSDARRAAIVLAEQGAEGLRKYTAETTKAGTAEEMAAARMKGFAGAMESFKGSVETLGIVMGTLLLPAATAAMEVLTSAVNWMGDNTDLVIALAAGIGGALVAALVVYTASMWAAAAATLAATWPIIAVVAGIGLLVAAVVWAYQNVEWFATGVQLWMKLAGAWFGFLWTIVKAVFRGIVTVVSAVVSWFMEEAVPFFQQVARFVIAAFKLWSAPIRIAIALVWAVVSWLIDKLRGPFAAVFGFIQTVIRNAVANFLTVWRGLTAAYTFVRDLFIKIRDGIAGFVGPIVEKVVNFVDDFTQPIQDIVGDAFDWGVDLIQGFWEGIKSMGAELWSNIEGFIQENVPGPVLKVLDMGSPSKLFRQYGEWTAEGLALGMKDGTKGVHDAAVAMVPTTRVANPGMAASQPGGLTSGSGQGPIHVYVGDREITDIVRVEQSEVRRRDAFDLAYGRV